MFCALFPSSMSCNISPIVGPDVAIAFPNVAIASAAGLPGSGPAFGSSLPAGISATKAAFLASSDFAPSTLAVTSAKTFANFSASSKDTGADDGVGIGGDGGGGGGVGGGLFFRSSGLIGEGGGFPSYTLSSQ